jgi:ribosomal protein S27AE
MTLRLARTNAEAHIYMELQPCDNCGEGAFSPDSVLVEVDGDLASRYAGPCPRCGIEREFLFRVPEDVVLPDPENPTFGENLPSQLVDPGQWLWFADVMARGAPAEPSEQMTPQQRRQARYDLLMAAAAIDQVLLFVPDGADTVPESAAWTQTGHRVYSAEPGRFHRRRLDVVRRTYRELAERFRDQPPDGQA